MTYSSGGLLTTKAEIIDEVFIQDYKIHYEVHGKGPKKVVFVSGLITSFANYSALVDYFANKHRNEFSCLLMDTRGYGFSTGGKSWRYKTSGMAQDVAKVLEAVGWIQDRSVHLVGISMGGMIAQELALVIPSRFRTMTLLATQAHFNIPTHNLKLPFKLLRTFPNNEARVNNAIDNLLFKDNEWLNSYNDKYPQYETNRKRVFSEFMFRLEKLPRCPLKSFVGQLCACLTHSVSKLKLAKIGLDIPHILVVTGTKDMMIHPRNTDFLATHLNARKLILQGKGHGLTIESEKELIPELSELFQE